MSQTHALYFINVMSSHIVNKVVSKIKHDCNLPPLLGVEKEYVRLSAGPADVMDLTVILYL